MPSSLTNAEVYFAPTNHIKSAEWAAFESDIKQAAIAQAKRILGRIAKCADIEAFIVTNAATGVIPEYAIYEQALWMLQNQPMANADGSFAVVQAADPETDNNARKAQMAEISPEALRWLVPSGNIVLSRG
jgi:hypothetical protein